MLLGEKEQRLKRGDFSSAATAHTHGGARRRRRCCCFETGDALRGWTCTSPVAVWGRRAAGVRTRGLRASRTSSSSMMTSQHETIAFLLRSATAASRTRCNLARMPRRFFDVAQGFRQQRAAPSAACARAGARRAARPPVLLTGRTRTNPPRAAPPPIRESSSVRCCIRSATWGQIIS